ncbi:unnamed protein product [Ectocarpus sp. 12 AP-2014]
MLSIGARWSPRKLSRVAVGSSDPFEICFLFIAGNPEHFLGVGSSHPCEMRFFHIAEQHEEQKRCQYLPEIDSSGLIFSGLDLGEGPISEPKTLFGHLMGRKMVFQQPELQQPKFQQRFRPACQKIGPFSKSDRVGRSLVEMGGGTPWSHLDRENGELHRLLAKQRPVS